MKFSFLHKSASLVLAVLVLFSTMSLTVEKHFCGGQLIDVAVFTKLHRCGDGISEMPTLDTLKKSCCKDEVDIIEGVTNLHVPSFQGLDVDGQDFAVGFIITYYNLILNEDSNLSVFRHYEPPNLVKEIYLFNETYII